MPYGTRREHTSKALRYGPYLSALNGGYIWNKTEIKLKQNILFQFYFRRGYMWNKTETKHWNNPKTF